MMDVSWAAALRAGAATLLVLASPLTGCAGDGGGSEPAPGGGATTSTDPAERGDGAPQATQAISRYVVVGPAQPSPGVDVALDQVVALLDATTTLPVQRMQPGALVADAGTLALAIGGSSWADGIVPASEVATLAAEGYALRRGTTSGMTVLAAVGPDELGTQYAAYALLEALGFGFFHPEDTFFPPSPAVPASLNVRSEPVYPWRGMHLHTMHPIELMDSLLVPSEEGLAEARRYIDWLVANKQNYFQWVLQDTVDLETWIPHAQAVVAYAHERGLRVGIDTPFQFIQQNGWVLAPGHVLPVETQIRRRLDRVLEGGFDVINVELGSSEFFPTDDVETVDMLNFTAAYLDETYGVELISKVHCSTGQTAPNFGGINFNFLPGLADPRVGVLPHTVQLYDLYRPAPTYDNEDFSDMRAFLLGEIGERTVLYYPETAYWVSFDVDVPLFLPHYVFSRWNDLHRLAGSGMDGQVNFSSGFEWGYWLGDWAAAAFAWDPTGPWQDQLARFTRVFGAASSGMQTLLVDIIEEQGEDLVEGDLLAYLIGQDVADDFGYLVGIHAQPARVLFYEIREMDAEALLAFEADLMPRFTALAQTYDDFDARMTALGPLVSPYAGGWHAELARALSVMRLRIHHSLALVEGTISKRKGQLGLSDDGEDQAAFLFEDAREYRRAAETIIAQQEAAYRWPASRIARRRENPTSYEFGYLYTTSDAYHWRRDELKAVDRDRCPCLGNITNQLANLFGEGHPLERLVEALPPLPLDCLDRCAHPMASISEEGGSQEW